MTAVPNIDVKVTLTQKPDGLALKVGRRLGRTMASLGVAGSSATTKAGEQGGSSKQNGESSSADTDLKPITILYGSNAWTCKSYAEDMQTNVPRFGFVAEVNTLDTATENIPRNQPIIIIEPSYEGTQLITQGNSLHGWRRTPNPI
jgi:cytochrome P450/NADPH-cytochrome P450 reductase